MKKVVYYVIQKGKIIRKASFILVPENKLETELQYWRWNITKLGGWKILSEEVKEVK